MAEWHDKIADELAKKLDASGKQVGTVSNDQFVGLCKNIGNYQRAPKTEARNNIAKSLWSNHQLKISFGDNAAVIFVDRNALPII
ncbi:MAG: hypothetical protein H7Z12_17075 [Rhodospirillaceae bacterium]|nr:hypothetical protein [Rhodospirillales bacterium]